MSTENEYPYMGTEEPDGKIKVEGPLSGENLKRKMKAEDKPVIGVMANSKGNAILKVITTILNREKSDKESK